MLQPLTNIYKMDARYYCSWKPEKKDENFSKAPKNDFKKKVKSTNNNSSISVKNLSLDRNSQRNQKNQCDCRLD